MMCTPRSWCDLSDDPDGAINVPSSLLLIPGDRALAAVHLDPLAVLSARAHLRHRQRPTQPALELHEHEPAVLGVDRHHVVLLRRAELLALVGLHRLLGLAPRLMRPKQAREHAR